MDKKVRRWTFVLYDLPNDPSKIRVKFWRDFKKMGALYLPYSFCILPKNDRTTKHLYLMRKELVKYGSVMVFKSEGENDLDNDHLYRMFSEERKREYNEIVEECEEFIQEIQSNIDSNNLTNEEVEELEENLEGLKRWYQKVLARELDMKREENVENKLQKCTDTLSAFAERVQSVQFQNRKS
jgi:hypothetical protein